jgi:hypothetical protein
MSDNTAVVVLVATVMGAMFGALAFQSWTKMQAYQSCITKVTEIKQCEDLKP